MDKYIAILNWLLSLGPKLDEVFAAVQRIITELQTIGDLVTDGRPVRMAAADSPSLSAEEQDLESQLVAKLTQTQARGAGSERGGIFDSGLILKALRFIRENPEIAALLMKLFGI